MQTQHTTIPISRSFLGEPDDQLLQLINAIAPTRLRAKDVFVVSGVPSTTAADAYYTHMDRATTFPRFVRALKAGSAFLDSHDIYRLPIGSSFWGEVRDVEGGKAEGVDAEAEVFALWYMVRHHNVPGSGNTDDYIRGIETGVTRKLSIGFGGSEMRIVCDEDGSDLWDWDSNNWPGKRLDNGRVVLYTIFDADLFETSQVYKNATPGALISRWQALITDRRINPAEAERLGRIAGGHRFVIPNFRSYRPASARPVPSQEGDDSAYRYARIGRPSYMDPRPLERVNVAAIFDLGDAQVFEGGADDGLYRDRQGEVIAEIGGHDDRPQTGHDRREAESDLYTIG